MMMGSIELARTICEELKGELQDGEQYGSVDIAEILSARVRNLEDQRDNFEALYLGSVGSGPKGHMCVGECQHYIELNRERVAESTHLRMQIGYLAAELQIAGDKRSTPEIVEAAAKACA